MAANTHEGLDARWSTKYERCHRAQSDDAAVRNGNARSRPGRQPEHAALGIDDAEKGPVL